MNKKFAQAIYWIMIAAILLSIAITPGTVSASRGYVLLPMDDGTYDDTNGNIVYVGWVARNNPNCYLKTEHISTSIGSTASFTFNGKQFSLYYRKAQGAGIINVMIDGDAANSINIDQSAGKDVYQRVWTSSLLSHGDHDIVISHTAGNFVNFDAVKVVAVPTATPIIPTKTSTKTRIPTSNVSRTPTPSRTPTKTATLTPVPTEYFAWSGYYDDSFPGVKYSDHWYSRVVQTNYMATEHYSDTVGSVADIAFYGNNISFSYRKDTVNGYLRVFIDDAFITDVSQYAAASTLATWSSVNLGYGLHHLVLQHVSGPYVTFDAFDVVSDGISTAPPTNTPTASKTPTETNTPDPTEVPDDTDTPTPTRTPTDTPEPSNTPFGASVGKIDDSNPLVRYSFGWETQRNHDSYYGGYAHYTKMYMHWAELDFTGSGINLIYRTSPGAGKMRISIDGIVVTTINTYSIVDRYKRVWYSGSITPGEHTIQVINISERPIFVDAFEVVPLPTATSTPTKTPTETPLISDTPTVTRTPTKTATALPTATYIPFSSGTYDDTSSFIHYFGWKSHRVSSSYKGTETYSAAIGQTAVFSFYGNAFTIHYRKYSSLGVLGVKVDGVQVGAVDQYAPGHVLYQRWYWRGDPGYHTVTLTHTSNTFVVLDAVTIGTVPTLIPTSTPGIPPTPTNTPIAPPAGKYDDTSSSITYDAGWDANYILGDYLNSEHQTKILTKSAVFKFHGSQVIVYFRKSPIMGTMSVVIKDDTDTVVSSTTVNQYNSRDLFGQTWSSPVFMDGYYTLTLTYQSGYTAINLDAIEVK